MSIESSPEYDQMIKMRPATDRLYKKIFGEDVKIERFPKGKDGKVHILDRKFSIDTEITLSKGPKITFQEKSLSNKFYHYRTITFEYHQNRFSERRGNLSPMEPGDFFHLAPQFYLCGYSDETGVEYAEWVIVRTADFVLWLLDHYPLSYLESLLMPSGGSNADFLPWSFDDIPKHALFASNFGSGIEYYGRDKEQ